MKPAFLLGPAGSGKTHRCLAEIRDALKEAPDGPPLLFVAPRQSTFLLERQLLSMGVPGFTRLEILSFERLARRILERLGQPVRDVLSEEGRVMALRALLAKNEEQLKGFGNSSLSPGFAVQLSKVLRELQRAGSVAQRLRDLKLPETTPALLADKLHDLALMLDAYRAWLKEHSLHDPDEMLRLAAEELARARKNSRPTPQFAGVWLDGFAEMTLPEIDLLAELLPCADRATLAFCLDQKAAVENSTAESLWSLNATTVQRCQERVRQSGLQPELCFLPEGSNPPPRFRAAPALARLVSTWTAQSGQPECPLAGLNLIECADPEAEALLAARLINHHVRTRKGRYREVSVIVRHMGDYADVLQRTFRRHNIPFFADHREPMTHHPVAELTRSALNMAAQDGRHKDWIIALKTGLAVNNHTLVDNLENATLAKGVRGNDWLDIETYRSKAALTDRAVKELTQPVEAFKEFMQTFSVRLDGPALAMALRTLWTALRVPETLEEWQGEVEKMDIPPLYRSMHRTAWKQLQNWCDNLALTFAGTALDARDWLPITEAGLSSLTLGVIPPALDQVFVGAVDRARQPDVKLTIILGLNAGVFPAQPAAPPLLNRAERVVLQSEKDLGLGWDAVQLASRENYYAYIACTRASERLCVCWSRRGADGKSLTRSAVAERLLVFAGLKAGEEAQAGDVTQFDGRLKTFTGHFEPEAVTSLPELLECHEWDRALPAAYDQQPAIGLAAKESRDFREQLLPAEGEASRRLNDLSLDRLYPEKVLRSSVSALETFAECPFRHFAEQQLRLKERDEFKADPATIGTLLHAILNEFHKFTLREKTKWRNWSPEAAANKLRALGAELMATEKFVHQSQDPLVRWESEQKIEGLALAVKQMVAWFATCGFDPVLSEFRFRDQPDSDGNPPDVPAWNIALDEGHTLKLQGSLDRLDVCVLPDARVLVSIFDYKTGGRTVNEKQLQNGLELQLLGYLAFAVDSNELKSALVKLLPNEISDASTLLPGGAFYVPLSPKVDSQKSNATDAERKDGALKSLCHQGRADRQLLEHFDKSAVKNGRTWSCALQFKPNQFKDSDQFAELLNNTHGFLMQHAGAIFEGCVGARPVRFSTSKTACDYCPFQSVCRFEPVFGSFRVLKSAKPVKTDADGPNAAGAKPAGSHREAQGKDTRPKHQANS